MHIYKYNNNQYLFEKNGGLLIQQLSEGKSLIRFGDGEFYVMEGINLYFQDHHQDLSTKLREIVQSESPNLLKSAEPGRQHHLAFLKPDTIYYSNISRICNYAMVGRIISLFNNQNVVCVHHCKDWRLEKIFKKAKSYKFILVESTNCFQKYQETLAQCKTEPANTLFYLSCGPTAKLLGWELHNAGYRIIDLGRFHDKLKKKVYRRFMA